MHRTFFFLKYLLNKIYISATMLNKHTDIKELDYETIKIFTKEA